MTLLFKTLGFALIIAVCTSAGFSKANKLKVRVQKLYNLQKGVLRLKELIRLNGGEIDRLIAQSFDSYPIDYSLLEASEREITENLIKEIGMLDRQSAYKRCEMCLSLLAEQHALAQQKHFEVGKLYKSIGVLSGILICIFFV